MLKFENKSVTKRLSYMFRSYTRIIFMLRIKYYVKIKERLLHNARGFGGLEVACWHLVPKFAGSNPAEAFGFFRAKKSSARLPSEGK